MADALKINTGIADIVGPELRKYVQKGKVILLVLDGTEEEEFIQVVEAVRHGETSVQTVKGQFKGVAFHGEERVERNRKA